MARGALGAYGPQPTGCPRAVGDIRPPSSAPGSAGRECDVRLDSMTPADRILAKAQWAAAQARAAHYRWFREPYELFIGPETHQEPDTDTPHLEETHQYLRENRDARTHARESETPGL